MIRIVPVLLLTLIARFGFAQCAGGSLGPAASVVCSGGSKTLTLTGAASTGPFQWQTANSSAGPWTTIGSFGATYNFSGITATKYVRVSSTPTGCGTVLSTTAVISPASTPVVTLTNLTSTNATVNWAPFGTGQYNITWSGAGVGSQSGAQSPFTITGLTPGQSICVNVTLTSISCPGVTTGQACDTTLCAKPYGLTFTSPSNNVGKVSWNPVTGANGYRVFYRPFGTTTWSSVDTTGTSKTLTGLIGNTAYQVRVAALNCPQPGMLGDHSITAVTTILPSSGVCSAVPTATVVSNCMNQLTITLAGGSVATKQVTFRRVYPSYTAGITLNTSSSVLNVTIPTSTQGAIWEVRARDVCAIAGLYSAWSAPDSATALPMCGPVVSPIAFSAVTTSGFTASWINPVCTSPVIGKRIYYKPAAAANYTFQFTSGSTPNAALTGLLPGTLYNVYVRLVYCNGALGPSSAVASVMTL